jgi:hypothetical protein
MAIASPRTQTNLILKTSPQAIMERFTGLNAALNAPDWTSWERKTWEFQQPQLNFASLFVWMAKWEENKHEVCLCYFRHTSMLTDLFQPGLPYKMARWVKSIAASNLHAYGVYF